MRGDPIESAVVDPPAAAYCRAARRLRSRLAGRPVRLHRALRELNTRGAASTPRAGGAAMAVAGLAAGFAAEVRRRMDGPVLRLAQRRALLATAQRLGIGRFEANLVIAAVQHERRGEAGLRRIALAPDTGIRICRAAPAVLALFLQGLIAWGAWRVWCG